MKVKETLKTGLNEPNVDGNLEKRETNTENDISSTTVSTSRRKFLGGVGAAPLAIGALGLAGPTADASNYYKYKKYVYKYLSLLP